jgi:SAM-dependent methyltransferase
MIPPMFGQSRDDIHLPLDDDSVDIVLSNELVEHLHPNDAADQIAEVYRILKPNGVYLCGTPNRISGPYDCSNIAPELPCAVVGNMYVANGLHLKEYTNGM